MICPGCKTEFQRQRSSQRWCSQRCRETVGNRQPNLRFACTGCGEPVERYVPPSRMPHPAFRYCGKGCAGKDAMSNPASIAWLYHLAELEPGQEPTPFFAGEGHYMDALRVDPCSYCGGPGREADHIVPRTQAGPDHWANYTGACRSCNASKQTTSALLFMGYRQAKADFAPWQQAVAA